MATTTSNLGLTKPAYADTADIEVINGNMDILDASVDGVENGLALISNNNTHAAVTAGQYIYVRKHGTLAEGLYKARSNIAANATLSTANLQAASGGLGMEVASLSENMGSAKFKKIPINDTTDQYGNIEVDNTLGSQGVFLLRNTFNDGVSGSFGVANLESITASKLTFKFRTLKDGSVLASKVINMSVIVAYD